MRTRYIKPSFYKNDILAELGPHAQLLFTGLWCLADKDGRLEDRPKKIKAEIFPYYPVQIEQLLEKLSQNGFIVQYAVGDGKYIEIVNFVKHQNPHPNEKGLFPGPCDGEVVPPQSAKKEEQDKPDPPSKKDFDLFWKTIKHRPSDSKAQCWEKWQVLHKNKLLPSIEFLLQSAKLANEEWGKKNFQFVIGTHRFLNQRLWESPGYDPSNRQDQTVKKLRVGKEDCALCKGSGTAAKKTVDNEGVERYTPYACPCSQGKEYPSMGKIMKPDPKCPLCGGRGHKDRKVCTCLREVDEQSKAA